MVLSYREKLLIVVLGLILLNGLVIPLLILPYSEHLQTEQKQLTDLEAEKVQKDMYVNNYTQLENKNNELKQNIEKVNNEMLQPISQAEVDSIIYNLFTPYQVTWKNVNFGEYQPVIINEVESKNFVKRTVTIDLSVDIEQFMSIVDDLQKYNSYLLVTSVAYSLPNEAGIRTLNVSFEYYTSTAITGE